MKSLFGWQQRVGVQVRLSIALVMLIVSTGGCGNDGERGNAVAPFDEMACEAPLPTGQEANARCGCVTVPEDRARPRGRAVRLAVTVLQATGPNRASDPIVYLGGGPGGAVLDGDLPAWTAAFAAPLQASRDIVFFDQRGSGRSEPLLACPEYQAAYASNFAEERSLEEAGGRLVDAMRRCHDRLIATGVDLAKYRSTDIVADMGDIMRALGYRQWNVYGLSYGGRVALTAMRDAPESIRSVVLDSPLAIQANLAADQAANSQRAVNNLLAACANDSDCNARYPNLSEMLFAVVDQLNASPAVLHPLDGTGTPSTQVISGDLFLLGVGAAMQDESLIPILPALIRSTARQRYELLTPAAAQLAQASSNAFGMAYSVRCGEDIPFNTPAVVAAATQDVLERIKGPALAFTTDVELGICRVWGLPEPPAVENEPVVSDLPTLILGGEFDQGEPYGRLAAQTLSNSTYLLFRGLGHVVIDGGYRVDAPSCAIKIMADFFADPGLAPDDSCLEDLPPTHFL